MGEINIPSIMPQAFFGPDSTTQGWTVGKINQVKALIEDYPWVDSVDHVIRGNELDLFAIVNSRRLFITTLLIDDCCPRCPQGFRRVAPPLCCFRSQDQLPPTPPPIIIPPIYFFHWIRTWSSFRFVSREYDRIYTIPELVRPQLTSRVDARPKTEVSNLFTSVRHVFGFDGPNAINQLVVALELSKAPEFMYEVTDFNRERYGLPLRVDTSEPVAAGNIATNSRILPPRHLSQDWHPNVSDVIFATDPSTVSPPPSGDFANVVIEHYLVWDVKGTRDPSPELDGEVQNRGSSLISRRVFEFLDYSEPQLVVDDSQENRLSCGDEGASYNLTIVVASNYEYTFNYGDRELAKFGFGWDFPLSFSFCAPSDLPLGNFSISSSDFKLLPSQVQSKVFSTMATIIDLSANIVTANSITLEKN